MADRGFRARAAEKAESQSHSGVVRKKILTHSVLLLVAGSAVVVAAYMIVTFIGLPKWVDAVKDDMTAEELKSLGRVASDKAIFTTETLKQTQIDLKLLAVFAQNALNRDILQHNDSSLPLFSGIEAQGFPSTTSTWDGSTQFNQNGLKAQGYMYACPVHGEACTARSFEHAVILITDHRSSSTVGYRTTAPFAALPSHTQTLLNQTSSLGLAMRSLRFGLDKVSKRDVLLYAGFEDYQPGEDTSQPAEFATFQTFPGANMEAYRGTWSENEFKDWGAGRTCDPRWQGKWPSTGRTTVRTYDPRCRGWYQDARTAGKTIFTAPYEDASTGILCITAAAPIRDKNGVFRGVVGIDFGLDALDKSILGMQILDDGYGFMMSNRDATAVVHKDFDLGAGTVRTVAELEGLVGNSEFEAATLQMRKGCTGTAEYGAMHGTAFMYCD